jgi:uncharacterized protein (DUF1800 family)
MIQDQTIETPVSLNMTPYTGPWTTSEASHLLRRTLFGATFQQIQNAVTDGLSTTLTNLFTIPVINPPLTYLNDEAIAAFGSTWINSVYPSGDSQPTENARNSSLAAWMMKNINTESFSIAEKICLFWQNHFAAENSFDARATYNYHTLLRTHSLGNFKQFIKDMTVDPSMLFFLNGVSNQSFSPNENYSRELLELYSIGKGIQIGVGDYSTYTESDVSAGAKILTGWTVDGMRSTSLTSPVAVFNQLYHDSTTKQLSAHFGNSSVTNSGATEYQNYIDIIFQQPALATFICAKLYRYFVNYDITTDVQDNVIPEMANTFISNNFEILPVLQQLFSSEHFYDVSLRGTLIKNPLELVFSMLNTSQSIPNYDLATNSEMYVNLYWFAGSLGQYYGTPPNVGGWPAYYQSPSYSKLWINSTYITKRFQIGYYLSILTGLQVNGHFYKIDALNLVNGFSNPSEPNAVIDDLCLVFCPKPISAFQKGVLKAVLTNNLPDFEWTDQYNDYVANSGNTTFSDPVRSRVEYVLSQLFQMPEFQTI